MSNMDTTAHRPRRRRPRGTGQLTELSPGRWQVRIELPPDDITGRRRRLSRTINGTAADARRLAIDLAAEAPRRTPASSRTLSDLLHRWWDLADLAPSTRRTYQTALNLLPVGLVNHPAATIDAPTLADLYRRLATAGESIHTIRTLAAAISSAYTAAAGWGWVDRNPARYAPVPAAPRRTPAKVTTDHIRALLDAADPADTVLIRLAWITGARRSELAALRWADLDAPTLTIAEALDPHDRHTRKTTKSGDTRRLHLDPDTLEILRRWRLTLAEQALAAGHYLHPTEALILPHPTDPTGRTPQRPDTITHRFATLRHTAGIPTNIRLHDIRHATASHLLAAGLTARATADHLGHTSTTLTLDRYADALPADALPARLLAHRLTGTRDETTAQSQ